MRKKVSATVDRSPEANCNRLLRLARLLRNLPSKQFHMGYWARKKARKKKAMKSCGMVCCIGGWATSVHPDLELFAGGVRNNHTLSGGADALSDAFNIDQNTAYDLVASNAPHQTPSKAAAAVAKVALAFAKEHDLSIRYE